MNRILHNVAHLIVKPLAERLGFVVYSPSYQDYRGALEAGADYTVSDAPVSDERLQMRDATAEVTLRPEALAETIPVDCYKGKRILEIGPKFGHHAKWIDRHLAPSEYVFCDFEQDSALHAPWKSEIKSPNRWVFGDLRTARELLDMEPFDLVLFLGVLYHTYHHTQMLAMLNRVTRVGGQMLFESTVDLRPDATLRLRWVNHGRIKAMPTVDALRLMLAWTGWRKVIRYANYRPASTEVLMLCTKTDEVVPPDHEFCPVVVPHKV